MKRNKIIFLIITLLVLSGVSIFYLSKYIAQYELGLKEVYIAKNNIRHRTKIDESHLNIIKVPKAYLKDDAYILKEDIVGKYVRPDSFIAKGSLFYKAYLESEDEMEDSYYTMLEKDEMAYDLRVRDISINTASLKEGQYLDLYLTINRKEVVSDLLISGTKLIGIYDNQNREVIKNEDKNIATITLSLKKEMIPYLNKALALGEIKVVTASNLYDDQKCMINLSEEMLKYLS